MAPSLLSLPTLTKRDPEPGANETGPGVIVAYVIGGLAALAVFLLVAFTYFRKRAKDRRNILIRAQDIPAVRATNMGIYAREQEKRLRTGNVRRANGASQRTLINTPSAGIRSPDSFGTPPPSYFDAAPGLPKYPAERTWQRPVLR